MTSTPFTRSAKISDASELARLFTALGHPASIEDIVQRWRGWEETGNEALVAVDRDGSLVGVATLHQMAVLHRPCPVGRITALVVDASARGQGIGRALISAAESQLGKTGCGLLEVTSNVRLVEAHGFYEHLGFDQTSFRFVKALDPMVVNSL